MKSTKKNKIFYYCVIISASMLAICARASFLYPMNNQVDPNCFLTVGKGMMKGMVIYKDLFEQKGPLLYLLHGIAYLISPNGFFGVYIIEVLSFAIFLYFSHKLIHLYLEEKYSYIILPLLSLLILTSKAFKAGDSAEEFGLAFMSVSMYYLIKCFHREYPVGVTKRNSQSPFPVVGYKAILINGILAGCVLWIKYSMLGFWFSWMMFFFFALLIAKQFKKAIMCCFVFLGGMFLTTIPWIVYFAVNGALFDWINAYFIANIFAYSNPMSLESRIIFILRAIYTSLKGDLSFSILVILGVFYFTCTKKYVKPILGRLALLSCGLFLSLLVYGGGQARSYYFLIFYPFSIFGFIVVFDFIRAKVRRQGAARGHLTTTPVTTFHWRDKIIIPMVLCFSIALTFLLSPSVPFMKYKREDLAQYKFAEIMNQEPNATLLNYGFLDGGFYFAADILPTTKYFCKLNLPHEKFPEMMDEQNRIIREKEVKYVVIQLESTQTEGKGNIPYLKENYKLISKEPQYKENSNYDYYLYKVN